MMLAILFSLKTMESLQNGLQPHSGATPLFSIRTVLLASSQSFHNTDADAWCKWELTLAIYINLLRVHVRNDVCYFSAVQLIVKDVPLEGRSD